MKKILIVDDEVLIHKIYKESLEREGFAVISAQNTQEGIQVAEEEKPNLIILDYKMPDLDAPYFLSMLRENPETKNIKVLIFTNYPQDTKIAELQHLGVGEVFLKTEISPSQLSQKVKSLLGEVKR